jgi:hypothetical protein
LAPEDIEPLMQGNAIDVVNSTNYATGYDQFNGWGLMNAGATLAAVDKPVYEVYHSGNPSSAPVITLENSGQFIYFPSSANVPGGTYNCDRYSVVHTYSNAFASNIQIPHHWPRFGSSRGANGNAANDGNDHFENCNFLISGNTATVTCTTYVYYLNYRYYGAAFTTLMNQWWPCTPTAAKTAYSLHLYDPTTVGVGSTTKTAGIEVFPNPVKKDFTLVYQGEPLVEPVVHITDVTGRSIAIEKCEKNSGNLKLVISSKDWQPGIYFVKLSAHNIKDAVVKLIKE